MTRNLRTWLLGTAAIVVAGVIVGRLSLGAPEVAAPAITPAEAKGYFGLLRTVADNPQNPVTPAKVQLGKALFFEPRLSKSGFIACASCHHLASGGGDGLRTSIGHRWVVRAPEGFSDPGRFEITKNKADRSVFKVPSLGNIALTAPCFHDGSVWTLDGGVLIMADAQLGTKLSLADADSIATFLASLSADPPLTVASGIDRHDAASRAQLN